MNSAEKKINIRGMKISQCCLVLLLSSRASSPFLLSIRLLLRTNNNVYSLENEDREREIRFLNRGLFSSVDHSFFPNTNF